MSKYLMTLTPQEAYFFGNEKTFSFSEKVSNREKRYYIHGERTPSQTTLLGALRYILLPNKKPYREYTEADIAENNAAVGSESFQYGKDLNFGKIQKISPLFLVNGKDSFVVTPFDHTVGEEFYTPFSEYIVSLDKTFTYPVAYDAKSGIENSYMRVSDGKIFQYKDIFSSVTRTGINRAESKNGLFKKEYFALKEGFSFAVYVTLDDDVTPKDTIVYLGQGKSLFTVKFTAAEQNEDKDLGKAVSSRLRPDLFYCFGDSFVNSDVYNDALFAITDIKDYRAYTTSYAKEENKSGFYKSSKKDSYLYKLIKAGSIFIPKKETFAQKFANSSVEKIGFNVLLKKTEEEK